MILPFQTLVLGSLILALPIDFTLAQNLADRTAPTPEVEAVLSRLATQPQHTPLPQELRTESAIYLQRRLTTWTESDARQVLGEPLRRRDAVEQGVVIGDIYAFRDPSNRYREFELMFDKHSRTMRAVFIYPWNMTWDECRLLWGEDVSTTKVSDGNIFRSYLSRRLDVLADKSGKVINLGLY